MYQSILNVKPKEKKQFCLRICAILEDIRILTYKRQLVSGKKMLDYLFINSKINNGYISIKDLLNEVNEDYADVYTLCLLDDKNIKKNELLANIELIINCFLCYRNSGSINTILKMKIDRLFLAIENYLLSSGYRIIENNNLLNIVQSEITIDLEEIKDTTIKKDIVNYFDYKNEKNIDEKRKIIVNLATKLEDKKNILDELFENGTSNLY